MIAPVMTMTTIGGREIDPLLLDIADVNILDIAHALSHLCRFAGHVSEFYSVAQHSVLVSYCVPSDDALHGLLHDASEAYLNDVIKPLKVTDALTGYRRVELRVQQTIYRAFGLSAAEPASVSMADYLLLQAEMRDLCPRRAVTDGASAAYADRITPIGPAAAKQLFFDRFVELANTRLSPARRIFGASVPEGDRV